MHLRIGLLLLALTLAGCTAYHESAPPQPVPATPARSFEQSKPQPSGSVHLQWTVPTERTDGKPLTSREIAAYRIYYGSSSQEYSERVEVAAKPPVRHTVQGLEPGKLYYFAVSAVDRDGREGPKSNEIRRLAR